jgi:hypothetical protein
MSLRRDRLPNRQIVRGWTGVIARVMDLFARVSGEEALHVRRHPGADDP